MFSTRTAKTDSTLGAIQDVKFAMSNNMLTVGYKSPNQVEVLELV